MKLKSKGGNLNPFFRWSGGKQRMVKGLIEKLPPEESYDEYHEPFLGGGALFMAGNFKKAFLNDINANLINAFRWVKAAPKDLHQKLEDHQFNLILEGEVYYYQIRKVYNEQSEARNLETAAWFIFLLQNNFNGIFRVNKKGEYNTSFGHLKEVRIPELQHLLAVQRKLQGVHFTSVGFKKALRKVGNRSFVYLDPPSARNLTHRYDEDLFDEKAHRKLAQCASQLSQKGAKVMVSIADTDLTRELYGLGWLCSRKEIKRKLNATAPSIIQAELILTNYEPNSE